MSKYFYCYNFRLKNWLLDNGMRYITTGKNKNSGTTFYLFEQSPRLNNLISQYNKKST